VSIFDRRRQVLASIFGEEYEVRAGQFKVNCFRPGCGDTTGNLEVNLEKGIFHCWKCNYSGNIRQLLKDYIGKAVEIDEYVSAEELSKMQTGFDEEEIKQEKGHVNLPKEFVPLWGDRELSFVGHRALKYVLGRMDKEDIEKHRIGYCGLGYYKWRIIIPVIENGEILYFAARVFLGQGERYRNPKKEDCGVGSEEVIFNIDSVRELKRCVINEGVFDAIKVGADGVALFGKHISDKQVNKLLFVDHIYVMLDQDAIKDSLLIAYTFLKNGRNENDIYLVSPPSGDPSDWPRGEIRKWIAKARHFGWQDSLMIEAPVSPTSIPQ
jgi:hypothetical protein